MLRPFLLPQGGMKRQAQSARRRDQSHTRCCDPSLPGKTCAERCGGIDDTVQHHFGRRKTGIKSFVPVLLQTVIRKCLTCAGCKVIAERTASKCKRRCSKAGGKNHQRTGNQGGHLTCNQRFSSPENIGDNAGGSSQRLNMEYLSILILQQLKIHGVRAVQPTKPPQSENSRPWS